MVSENFGRSILVSTSESISYVARHIYSAFT
jgi:hypothetical protein